MGECLVEFETILPDRDGVDLIVTAKVIYSPGEGYFVEDLEATCCDTDVELTSTLNEKEHALLEARALEQAIADAEDAYESRDPDTRDR